MQKGEAVTTLPIRPLLKTYRGPNLALRRKINESNLLAHRIARHLNEKILSDPQEMQQHFFEDVAAAFGCSPEVVRAAIPAGGHYSINLRVSDADRQALRADLGMVKPNSLKQAASR